MPPSAGRAHQVNALEYLDALSRAVPQHIVRAVLAEASERSVQHVELDGTAFYADLAGFTPMCEKLAEAGAEGLSRLSVILDRLFGALVDQAIAPYSGSVVQFGGDSVTAFFDGTQHAQRAAAAALSAQRIMHGEVGRLAVEQSANLALRVGLASGRIVLPVLGDLTRRVVVCAGEPTHRALSLQAGAAPATVTVDASTIELLGGLAELVDRHDSRATLRGLRAIPPAQAAPPLDLGDPESASKKISLLEPFVPQPLALRLRTTPTGWRIEGELRHVIVVFSEVTGLHGAIHGMEAIEHISRSLLRAYRRHAGVVSKSDVTPAGHRTMVLFGLHEPSENDAERALLAAIEATNRVKPLIQPYGDSVQMRTGVHCGRVYFGAIGSDLKHDITVIGDTVNVAARCCNLAANHEVLATDVVAKLIGGELRMSERTPMQVKGKKEPLRTVAVHGPAEGYTHVAKQRNKTRFLAGRDSERAHLAAVVDSAADGCGHVVGICGDAGMGKSALLAPLIDRWTARGGKAVVGRCRYATRAIPLAPVTRMFEIMLGLTQMQNESERRERIRAALAAYGLDGRAPELVALLQPVRQPDGTTEAMVDLADPHAQERVISSIVQFIAQRVRRERLLYVCEDIHYGDTLTLRLVCRLATLGRDWPFIFVGTYRPDTLLDDVRRTADLELVLRPLAIADVTQLIRQERASERVEHDLALFIWRRSGGNPRHTVELVRFLSERELLAVRASEVVAHPSVEALNDLVPQSLAHVALARFAALGETTRRVLRLASAIGRRFDRALIEHIAKNMMDDESIDAALASLESERVLTSDGDFAYVFRDDLTRAVAYTTVPESERRRVHARIADALDHLPPSSDARGDAILAHHRERAGQLHIAAAHYERAAFAAGQASMNRECAHFVEAWERVCTGLREHERPSTVTLARMTLLRLIANVRMGNVRKSRRAARAISVIGLSAFGDSDRLVLAYWLGETARLSGKPTRARRELAHVARQSVDPHLKSDAAHLLALMAVAARDWKLAVRWIEQALQAADDDPYRTARIALTHAGAWVVRGERGKAVEIYDRVLSSGAHREHVVLRALASAGLARCSAADGKVKRAVELAEQGLRFARGSGRPTLEAGAMVTLGAMQLEHGDAKTARDTLSRAVELARELGDALSLANALVHFGASLVECNELNEGMRCLVDGETRCIRAELKDGEEAARRYLQKLSTSMPAPE